MILLEPTQKFINAYTDGDIAKYHKFWFNIDLVFMATKEATEEERKEHFKMYSDAYGINLNYKDLMENFNVSFATFIEEFKDMPELYNKFNFKG